MTVICFASGQGVLLDIDRELQYWRDIFHTTEFSRTAMPFQCFIPTIKFGYDCFLLFHNEKLAEVLPRLRIRYQETLPVTAQLDWRWADQVIRHAWGRMRVN